MKKAVKFFVAILFIISVLIVNVSAQEPEYVLFANSEQNTGLYSGIEAFYSDDIYNFVIPKDVNLTEFKFDVKKSGNVLKTVTANVLKYSKINVNIEDTKILVNLIVSDLPVLYIDIDEQYASIKEMNDSPDHSAFCYGDVTMSVPKDIATKKGCNTLISSVGNDKKADRPCTMRIRGRGNTTWKTNKDKQRPYQFKLEEKLNFLGMGENKDWALLRNENQNFYLRNKIAYSMADEFGMKYTPRIEMVDVYMNCEYKGLYSMASTVEIGKNSVHITDIDEKIEKNGSYDGIDLTGGYLVEMDNNPENLQFSANSRLFTIKSPETLDTNTQVGSRYDYIKNLFTDVVNAIYGDGKLSDGRHFSEVLDLESTARYFLSQELVGNYDAFQGSTFFYKDTDYKDKKIYMGPVWDCDMAFDIHSDSWCLPMRNSYFDHKPLLINALSKHKEFMDYVFSLYFNDSIGFDFKNYEKKIDKYSTEIKKSAQATCSLYGFANPDYNIYKSYILKKHTFVTNNLNKLRKSATKGNDLYVYRNRENKDCGVYQIKDTLYYKYENKSDEEKNIYVLVYDDKGKLTDISKKITVKANTTLHSQLKLASVKALSYVTVYDGNMRKYKKI